MIKHALNSYHLEREIIFFVSDDPVQEFTFIKKQYNDNVVHHISIFSESDFDSDSDSESDSEDSDSDEEDDISTTQKWDHEDSSQSNSPQANNNHKPMPGN